MSAFDDLTLAHARANAAAARCQRLSYRAVSVMAELETARQELEAATDEVNRLLGLSWLKAPVLPPAPPPDWANLAMARRGWDAVRPAVYGEAARCAEREEGSA